MAGTVAHRTGLRPPYRRPAPLDGRRHGGRGRRHRPGRRPDRPRAVPRPPARAPPGPRRRTGRRTAPTA
ncbi:hypothetical protein ADK60_39990, partial [Streptomyces sp. XY431]